MTLDELLHAIGPLLGTRSPVEGDARDWPIVVFCNKEPRTPTRLILDEGRIILTTEPL